MTYIAYVNRAQLPTVDTKIKDGMSGFFKVLCCRGGFIKYFSFFDRWSHKGRKLTAWVVIVSHLYSALWSSVAWAIGGGLSQPAVSARDNEAQTQPTRVQSLPVNNELESTPQTNPQNGISVIPGSESEAAYQSTKDQRLSTDEETLSKQTLLQKVNTPLKDNLGFGIGQLSTLTIHCDCLDAVTGRYVLKLHAQGQQLPLTTWEKTFELSTENKLETVKLKDPHRNAQFGFTLSSQGLTVNALPNTFNYCFNIAASLHIHQLSTRGYIDIQKAEKVHNYGFIKADDGLRIHALNQIINYKHVDLKQPRIVSKRRVILKTPLFNNCGGKVISPLVYGWFDSSDKPPFTLVNNDGVIAGTHLLHIYTSGFAGWRTGHLRSPSGTIALHTRHYNPHWRDILEAKNFIFTAVS